VDDVKTFEIFIVPGVPVLVIGNAEAWSIDWSVLLSGSICFRCQK
jgi:hypothetical protein